MKQNKTRWGEVTDDVKITSLLTLGFSGLAICHELVSTNGSFLELTFNVIEHSADSFPVSVCIVALYDFLTDSIQYYGGRIMAFIRRLLQERRQEKDRQKKEESEKGKWVYTENSEEPIQPTTTVIHEDRTIEHNVPKHPQ